MFHLTQRFLLSCLVATIASGRDIPVEILHAYAGAPLAIGSLRYENSAGETLSVTRLSYLLSGFEIQTDDQAWHPLPAQDAWLDAGRRRSGFVLTGAPAADAKAIRFRVGPDPATNATDPQNLHADHPLNPNLNGLHWSWQGGYIFLALEGHFRARGEQGIGGYSFHLANDPNRTTITVELPQNPGGIALRFDLEKVLAPLAIGALGTSTHSRDGDAIAAKLRADLPAAWSSHGPRHQLAPVPEISRPSPKYPPREGDELYRFSFDPKFSFPNLPADNPMTVAGVALGEKLFHEPRLSRDDSISCASCHQSGRGLADPRRFSLGVDGKVGKRNAMPLFNLAWKESYFWDGRVASLRGQVLHPIQDPLEMDQPIAAAIAKLQASDDYPALFEGAFGVPGIDSERLTLALEQFLLSLTSYRSRFDLAMRGKAALSAQEQRGFELFFTEYDPRTQQFGADCFHCHGGALFTSHGFANNGLDASFADAGRGAITGIPSDLGKFAVPSLRNVALTAPYMHDGRFESLEEVIAHYDRGLQRSATLDPNLAKHPRAGIGLSEQDQRALVAFLKALTEQR